MQSEHLEFQKNLDYIHKSGVDKRIESNRGEIFYRMIRESHLSRDVNMGNQVLLIHVEEKQPGRRNSKCKGPEVWNVKYV